MLHTKYRPETLDQVVGHKEVITNLKKLLSSPDKQQTFLFTGPPGTGKTTIARAISNELKIPCKELDSASDRGIDAMKETVEWLRRNGRFFQLKKVVIFDECHQITKDAQNVLLKALEEPAPDVFIIFCTTEPDKLIEPLKKRCYPYRLKPVSDDEIRNFLKGVIKKESINITEGVLEVIVSESKGIPRDALIKLGQARVTDTFDEAVSLICE